MSQRDQTLVKSLGIPIARLAEALDRSRQTVTRGVRSSRDYFKPVDLTKLLSAWRNSDAELYSLAKSAIGEIYPEASPAIVGAAEVADVTALSSSMGEDAAAISRESVINGLLLKEYPNTYKTDFKLATKLSVMGTNLRRIIYTHMDDISGVLGRGGIVQVILVDPQSGACKYSAMQEWGRSDEESVQGFKQTIVQAYRNFLRLKDGNRNGENLTIKKIDYPPAFGLDAMEFEDTRYGNVYVRYYPIRSEVDDRPILVLRNRDGYWYHFYKDQFARHWELAVDWLPE